MKKILVIDDEKPTLGMFKLLLDVYGYDVFTAENGTEGLKIFEKENPSITITDIKMPGMDGLEVLRHIKRSKPSAEVLVITGHGDLELALDALNIGATDFISKPIQKSALDDALKKAEMRIKSDSCGDTNILVRESEDMVFLDIDGQFTAESEAELKTAFAGVCERGASKIVFSFDEKCTMTGAGIEALSRVLSGTETADLQVAIAGITENLMKIFQLVGIARMAKTFKHEEEAVISLSGTR